MIESFADKETQKIFDGLTSTKYANIQNTAKRKLDMIHFASSEQDLIIPPSNRFEHLRGNLKGYCSIRINDQYRIVFKFKNSMAYNVEITNHYK